LKAFENTSKILFQNRAMRTKMWIHSRLFSRPWLLQEFGEILQKNV